MINVIKQLSWHRKKTVNFSLMYFFFTKYETRAEFIENGVEIGTLSLQEKFQDRLGLQAPSRERENVIVSSAPPLETASSTERVLKNPPDVNLRPRVQGGGGVHELCTSATARMHLENMRTSREA